MAAMISALDGGLEGAVDGSVEFPADGELEGAEIAALD